MKGIRKGIEDAIQEDDRLIADERERRLDARKALHDKRLTPHQRRVIAAVLDWKGRLVGLDGKGRPVVDVLQHGTTKRWAIQKNGDPYEVTDPMGPYDPPTAQDRLAKPGAALVSEHRRYLLGPEEWPIRREVPMGAVVEEKSWKRLGPGV